MFHESKEHLFEGGLVHLAVADADAGVGNELLDGGGALEDAFDAVVEEVDLAAAGKFLLDGGFDEIVVEAGDDGVDGEAVFGWGFDHAEVAETEHGHVESAGDGGGRHGEGVDVLADLLETLFVADAEALLLVDDHEAEILELDVGGEEAVRSDGDVDPAGGEVFGGRLEFLGGAEAGEHLYADGEGGEAALEGFVVLKREHGGGRENGDLFAVAKGFEGGAHGDLGLAEADVAAEEAVHRGEGLHVGFDFVDGRELVAGGGVFEGVFEFALPVGVRGKGEAFGDLALGVELEELFGHVAHFGFDAGFGFGPGSAAEFVEGGFGVAGAAVLLDEVHAGERDVELVAAVVLEQHEVALLVALDDFAEAEELADAVLGMDHVVAGFEVADVGGERAHLADVGGDGGIGAVEEVFGAEEGGKGVREADAFADYAAAEDDARGLAGETASIILGRGVVRKGVGFPDSLTALFGAEDLFDRPDTAVAPNVRQMGAFAADIGDLKPGDYVVHTQHGIGQFLGLREIVQGDQKGDFMLLEYNGGNKLYVPLTRMDLIQKYRGAGDAKPSLDKLGGATWTKTKTRVKAKMRDMAEELLKLYAQRKVAEGFSFSPDSNWQREFEDSFEYTPTRDQLTAVDEIKSDMESLSPMDRLLCGDVGFGKTEVAMRAAFKALGDGKQVAVLAPTTVLAFQHHETFKRRFAAFPVRVEMFSRFRSPKELKASAEDLASGRVDIAIGTHRLLSPDIEFKDLGLMIIDEEQRFGVRHKERLKQIRQNVDSLTMSATPIPRTLHMSMLGLRDLSMIETPPKDRLSIHTVVARFNDDLIKTAIEQELARGGQVYFLHNRVESIFQRAAAIQQLVPDARIGVGHGQMDETALEKVLLGFMKHEFDVFVCTTIVENGIDIPLANTIIIERAERYGLSELYQLRGRVGRSNRRAYAYLLVPEDTELTEVARKRLAALREFSDLGAGFKIAALDLELRGAGNILGGEQHGHIDAVGYDMYMSLMEIGRAHV